MPARVIALGQAAAGDDGVALVVLDRLRVSRVPAGVELLHATEELALVPLLETVGPVVIVDAVVHAPPGQVLDLAPEALAHGCRAVSTHGVGVYQAIELARALGAEPRPASIRIVAVTISRPRRYTRRLSPAVAAAVPVAVERVLAAIGSGAGR
jgi:hydrogenase maturation protease